jgi:hypothetical protein
LFDDFENVPEERKDEKEKEDGMRRSKRERKAGRHDAIIATPSSSAVQITTKT